MALGLMAFSLVLALLMFAAYKRTRVRDFFVPERYARRETDRMAKAVGLNGGQKEQVYTLLKSQKEQLNRINFQIVEEMKNAGMMLSPREEILTRLETLSNEKHRVWLDTFGGILAVMSPAQKVAYGRYVEELFSQLQDTLPDSAPDADKRSSR